MSEDTPSSKPRRRLRGPVAAAAAVTAVLALTATYWFLHHRRGDGSGGLQDLATANPALYRQMVSAFYTGVTALDVDDNDRAKEQLTQATKLVPNEPAGWANLGLLHLRADDFDAAAQALERARALAPQSAEIEMLTGLLEGRRGQFAESMTHFRRATELSPKNLRARYALAGAIEREGGAQSDGQMQQQFAAILEVAPDNLVVLLDSIRIAAKQGDAQAVRQRIEHLAQLSGNWPVEPKQQLESLQKLVSAGNLRQATTSIAFLRNVLVRVPEFRANIFALQTSVERVGEPIDRFLTLPSPRPTPAPPDDALTFSVSPLSAGVGSGWTSITPAWLNKDALPVVFVANGRELRRADGSGASLPFPGGPSAAPASADGVLAVDWINDFRTGLALAGAGGLRLLQQGEDGELTDVTAKAVPEASVRGEDCYGAWAADIDLDGDLDIVVASRHAAPFVLRNNSDGTFKVIRPFAGVSGLRAFLWIDLDGDGVPDACLLDETGKLKVFVNERSGKFREQSLPTDVTDVVSIAAADVNRDGRFDLLALLADGRIIQISDKQSGNSWDASTVTTWKEMPARDGGEAPRLIVADLDSNGTTDLIVTGPAGGRAWLADAGGAFAPLSATLGARLLRSAVLSPNGVIEMLGLSNDRTPLRVTPHGTRGYHWQAIRPRAKQVKGDGRINSYGIGGELELRAGLLLQKAPIDSGSVFFGLGDNPQADAVRIIWPNGSVQGEFALKADQAVLAEQRLKGSCPMLFAWDGQQPGFVTDLIWRSPLGLRINAQDTAAAMQTEDWVKVAGKQLVAHDGYYDLRVTAELWETHYFDHISLMAVDHPAGTEVFVDERFAIPQPPLAVCLTNTPTPVTHAVDEHGNDVTELVRARDGKYVDSFSRGRYQGITDDHWTDVELGSEFPGDKPLVLLAFGWVHPTDSSINLALAQGQHAAPRGLAIEVPNGSGGWRVARDGLGFPAGKNKTIVLKLDGLWRPGEPRKLRLCTNLEVYWDSLACAILLDDDAARGIGAAPGRQTAQSAGKSGVAASPARASSAVHAQWLGAQRAELDYHGFSAIGRADEHSPELPDYRHLTGTQPHWRDLIGYYTRYGDVRELLERVDDRYVIMNAGDEMRLQFPALPAPSAGWVRDFVVIADGWEKDGDYNTAFSGTVLPLPRHDWPAYDSMPARLEDDPLYQRYPEDWVNYHTRYVTPDAFRDVLRPHDR